MARLLNSAVSKMLISLIKFYQLFISNKIDRSCIYKKNCSKYAIDKISISDNIILDIKDILKRIKGCKINRIICNDSKGWYIINGNKEVIKENQLNDITINDINQTLEIELN